MKIKGITIENVKSFRSSHDIEFDSNLNIFIGPNGGGKSNFLDILNIVIIKYLIHPWRIIYTEIQGGVTQERVEKINIFEPINFFLDKNDLNPVGNQIINLCLIVTEQDVNNLKIISNNAQKIIDLETSKFVYPNPGQPQYPNFKNSNFINDVNYLCSNINIGEILNYRIINGFMQSIDEKHQKFLYYLNISGALKIYLERFDIKLNELIAYFSPYRHIDVNNFSISIAQQNQFDLMDQYKRSTSKATSTITNLSNYYFAEKLRAYDDNIERFNSDPEVILVKDFLQEIGYDFTMLCVNKTKNRYQIILKQNNRVLSLDKTSSGEREIINLLLGLSSFNISNGVVIIDKPELHLHPRWQIILFDIIKKLAKTKDIQFFIVTHSPEFIDIDIIENKNIKRIFKENGESNIITPAKITVNGKNLFHIINYTNNSIIFFSDKVILVEGITDKLIFSGILEKLNTKGQIIEILSVGGKKQSANYREFLNDFSIKNYFIGDLDCLLDEYKQELDGLYYVDTTKINENLIAGAKSSKDANFLLDLINKITIKPKEEITNDDINNLREFGEYLKSRFNRFKDNLSQTDKDKISECILKESVKKNYILSKGELEDYFSSHLSKNAKVETVVKFIKSDFTQWFEKESEEKTELLKIINKINDD